MTRDGLVYATPRPPIRPLTAVGRTLRDLLPLGAVIATFAAVLGLFAVSPILLEAQGVAYLTSGGGLLAKFHPSTAVALLALGLRCLAARRPARTVWRLATDDPGIVLMLASVAIAAVFAVFIDNTPVTPLVDTFVLPVLIFVLLRDLDATPARWLAILVIAILVVNSIVAIVEFLDGWRLIHFDIPDDVTADPTRTDATFSWQAELALDWRAVALLGHPLVNGLIVGSFLLCLVAPGTAWLPASLRLLLVALEGASMFAFGARTALVLTAAFALWLIVSQLIDAVARGRRFEPRQIATALLCVGLLVLGLTVISETGFLDRTLQRFSQDAGSATTRLTMFELFEPISWSDLFLRPDKDLVATLQRIYGLEFGIESSWLGLALTYGFIVTGCIVIGVLAFCRSIICRSGRGSGFVMTLFMVLISVSATLSGKTTTFAMTTALIMLFMRSGPPQLGTRRSSLVQRV